MYEWDEAKRKANLKKHRLDFVTAHLVYENPDKVTYRIREFPEERFLDIALVNSTDATGSILRRAKSESREMIKRSSYAHFRTTHVVMHR